MRVVIDVAQVQPSSVFIQQEVEMMEVKTIGVPQSNVNLLSYSDCWK